MGKKVKVYRIFGFLVLQVNNFQFLGKTRSISLKFWVFKVKISQKLRFLGFPGQHFLVFK